MSQSCQVVLFPLLPSLLYTSRGSPGGMSGEGRREKGEEGRREKGEGRGQGAEEGRWQRAEGRGERRRVERERERESGEWKEEADERK